MLLMSRRVVIASAVRTAIGGFGGSLKSVPAYDLAAHIMKAAVERSKIDPAELGDIRFGSCMEPHNSLNIARVAQLKARLPNTTPAVTINRVCTSGMDAIASASTFIKAGMYDSALAGGVESMSNAPYVLPGMRWGARMFDSPAVDSLMSGLHAGSDVVPYPKDGDMVAARGKPYIMGMTAEFLAQKLNISRQEQDEVALRSHNNAEAATTSGRFKDEIVPVTVTERKKTVVFDKDEHFRPGAKMEDLAAMPSFFIPRSGTVTAGNASGINDGASAVVLTTLERAKALGLEPLVEVVDYAMGGCAPEFMGESPIPAIHNLLKKTGRKIGEYDLIELNEAFAVQYLAVEKQIGWKRDIANVNGSGIGLGHPVGSTGCRIVVTLAHEMRKRGAKRGLATICGGGGVGYAMELALL